MSESKIKTTDLASEEVQELLQAAMAGDSETLPDLRKILKANPKLWKEAGDLAHQARVSWMKAVAGPNLVLNESLGMQLDMLKEDLTRSSDSLLEKILIEQITLAWLEAYWASARDAQSLQQTLNQSQKDQLQKRVDRAHRRLQTSIKTLATVRKLITPPLSPFDLAMKPLVEGNGNREKSGSSRHPRMGAVPATN